MVKELNKSSSEKRENDSPESIQTPVDKKYKFALDKVLIPSVSNKHNDIQINTTIDITENQSNVSGHLKKNEPLVPISISSSEDDDEELDDIKDSFKLSLKRDNKVITWRDNPNYSRFDENKSSIIFTYSNVTQPEHFTIMNNFVLKMNATMEMEWSDRITHLIVGTNDRGMCKRTKKVFNAVLSNNFIININWIKESLERGKIISEFHFMPNDEPKDYDDNIFVKTAQVGMRMFHSPLEWVQYSAWFIYPVVIKRPWHDFIVEWIQKLGGKIVNRIADFNNYKKSEHIILIDMDIEDYMETLTPSKSKTDKWYADYEAVVVLMEWMFLCLTNYKRLTISDFYIPPDEPVY